MNFTPFAGASWEPWSDSPAPPKRDVIWLEFIRRCAERKSLRLLLLQDSLVRGLDTAGLPHRLAVDTLLSVDHFALRDRDVGDFVDVVAQMMADFPSPSSSPSTSSHVAAAAVLPFPVDVILADAVGGTTEKVPVINASSTILVEITSKL